ncbi:MAG: dTDP-4-dehydrorhamnose 3,5-epimerase family protein [Planctomycetes bacterium]|nr:dTDP-4-dehydrorhamnose 3,5-epimerase family protein [Planctomycetota bacterium]
MIDGVVFRDLVVHADEHGYLYEMLRADWPEFREFGQAYLTSTYPGVIKGWHFHEKQSDHFCVIKGMAKVVLYDNRKGSPTQRELNEFSFGEHRQKLLVFPPRVLHGIIALNNEPVWIINFPDFLYDYKNPDEHRVPWNTPLERADGSLAPYEWFRHTESKDLK